MSDKKTLVSRERDFRRLFSPQEKAELIFESGGVCSHPFCDYSYLTLQAHHLIQHARGGLTIKSNGLILCPKCHRLLHEGLIPQRLALLLKYWTKIGKSDFSPLKIVSSDGLLNYLKEIQFNDKLSASDKFHLLNDILIAANFLASISSRYFVFVNAIAAKVGILNDGILPIRSTFNSMLLSMDSRRKWAQILAANAFRYAKKINENWITLYFLHSRAVAYNARNKFERAVNEFNRALAYYYSMNIPLNRQEEANQEKARLIRERAVCRAKASQSSSLARSEVLDSLEISKSIGEVEDIIDGLNRCVEAFLYFGEYSKAEGYLSKIYENSGEASYHSQAIAMKMNAKYLISINKINEARDVIEKGLSFSLANSFNQQIYHFSRLKWNINNIRSVRELIIT